MSPRATPPAAHPRPFGGVRPQSGWWQAYYPGPDGHRVHETAHFPSEDAARTWLDDLARERARGSWHDPAAAHQEVVPGLVDFEVAVPRLTAALR
jgi:hypothetical protein